MDDKIHKEFLELVGFEDNEIPLVLPDWRTALKPDFEVTSTDPDCRKYMDEPFDPSL